MSLPKLRVPLFETIVPSTKEKVQFRPFQVREEKILLMAKATADQEGSTPQEARVAIIQAIRQIINNTVQTKKPGFLDALTTFDIEYLFLKIRAASVDNIVELAYRDPEDNQVYTVPVNLHDIEVTWPENIQNKIKINDDLGMILKFPTANSLLNVAIQPDDATGVNYTTALIESCIDVVYDAETMYPFMESTPDERKDFLDALYLNVYGEIQKFFSNLPHLYHKVTYTNSLGTVREVELSSLEDFFTLG
jgi:hypothetical protein